ncbi:hypothetical protein PIB30_027259 [Stylosanthes scabra]|uniref:Uncharacterized protein n=1 Tax=Stylosanthes scabra TaxID=79078 RepID=A0ABU6WAH6_9FABA|nr:hypothetical protein [Stylosanthes scabra]
MHKGETRVCWSSDFYSLGFQSFARWFYNQSFVYLTANPVTAKSRCKAGILLDVYSNPQIPKSSLGDCESRSHAVAIAPASRLQCLSIVGSSTSAAAAKASHSGRLQPKRHRRTNMEKYGLGIEKNDTKKHHPFSTSARSSFSPHPPSSSFPGFPQRSNLPASSSHPSVVDDNNAFNDRGFEGDGVELSVEIYSRDPIFLSKKLHDSKAILLKEFLSLSVHVNMKKKISNEVGSYELKMKKLNSPRGAPITSGSICFGAFSEANASRNRASKSALQKERSAAIVANGGS